MAKYPDKTALLEAIRTEHQRLEIKFAGLTPEEMIRPEAMGEWSVKDILAYLVDWEQRFIDWYHAGQRGEIPQTPAPGMTWRELPRLNQQGFERHRNEPLQTVLENFQASYQQILELVESIPETEMFTVGTYAWTGKRPLVDYIDGNTASHYNWARTQIRTTRIRKE